MKGDTEVKSKSNVCHLRCYFLSIKLYERQMIDVLVLNYNRDGRVVLQVFTEFQVILNTQYCLVSTNPRNDKKK